MTFYIAFFYHAAMLSTLAINTTNQTLNICLWQLHFILFFCYTFRPTRSSSLSLLSMTLDGAEIYIWYKEHIGDRGGTVVKALRYKAEGRCFDSRWCHPSDLTMALG